MSTTFFDSRTKLNRHQFLSLTQFCGPVDSTEITRRCLQITIGDGINSHAFITLTTSEVVQLIKQLTCFLLDEATDGSGVTSFSD